jgi:hypothetical protein
MAWRGAVFHPATPAHALQQAETLLRKKQQIIGYHVAHVAELADALDSGSSE